MNPYDYSLWLSNYGSPNVDFGFGKRHDSGTNKGLGYFGPVAHNGDYSTELSSFDNLARGEYPLMVPTLTRSEMTGLLGGSPSESVYQKASDYAEKRKFAGLSPFASAGESPYITGLLNILDF